MADQMPWWQDVRWIITTVLALWGAGLSTYQQLAKRWEQRPKVRVVIMPTIEMFDPETKQNSPQLSMKIKNVGQTAVYFKDYSAYVKVKGSETQYLLNKPLSEISFPYVLKKGDSFTLHVKRNLFEQALRQAGMSGVVKIKVGIYDALGNAYEDDWVDAKIDDLP